jgi:hypothetical protein
MLKHRYTGFYQIKNSPMNREKKGPDFLLYVLYSPKFGPVVVWSYDIETSSNKVIVASGESERGRMAYSWLEQIISQDTNLTCHPLS